ncbi:hypothetical protein CDD83_11103 [Cordyceps sp. RAO-2017]|nr:hypothetical protein CDD83_11103 [Cordyceps sp. RAO-2017]
MQRPHSVNDGFLPVNTWRGYIMVSTDLLPDSAKEKRRIYPELHLRDEPEPTPCTPTAAPDEQAPRIKAAIPPVPNHWNHEHPVAVKLEVDAELFPMMHFGPPHPSRSSASSIHSAEPPFPMSLAPAADDDALSSLDLLFPQSPWLRDEYGWGCDSPIGSEDASAATSPTFFLTEAPPNAAVPATSRTRPPPTINPDQSGPLQTPTSALDRSPKRKRSGISVGPPGGIR